MQIPWMSPPRRLSHIHLLLCEMNKTHIYRDSWNPYPLLRCWWMRNCHIPFCIDAAAVQAVWRRLASGGVTKKGGRPTTHQESWGLWESGGRGTRRKGQWNDLTGSPVLVWRSTLSWVQSLLCSAKRSWSQSLERSFCTHTQSEAQREWQRGGRGRGRCFALTWFALFLHPDMVARETWIKEAEGGVWLSQWGASFLYKGVKKLTTFSGINISGCATDSIKEKIIIVLGIKQLIHETWRF